MKKTEIVQKLLDYFQDNFPEHFNDSNIGRRKTFNQFLYDRAKSIENLFLIETSIKVDELSIEQSEILELKKNNDESILVNDYNETTPQENYEYAEKLIIEGYRFSYYHYLANLYDELRLEDEPETDDMPFDFYDFVLNMHDEFKLFGDNDYLIEHERPVNKDNQYMDDYFKDKLKTFKYKIQQAA